MDPQVRSLIQTIDSLHDAIYRAVEPLTDAEINWRHPQLSNTIGIMLRHIAGSERHWIVEVVGGRKVPRNRDAEFAHDALSKEAVVATLRQAQAEVKPVFEALTAADLAREIEVPFREERKKLPAAWALLHALEHTAYHLGQIQLFKKMAAGGSAGLPKAW